MTKYEAPSTDDHRIWDLWLSGMYQGAIVAADDAGVFAALVVLGIMGISLNFVAQFARRRVIFWR